MATIAEIYARGFKRDFRYYYTHWLPNGPMSVGVVGELVDRSLFRPLSTLQDRGIDFDPARDVLLDTSPSPMKFVSSSSVATSVKLAGEVNPNMPNIPEGSAGLKIEFGSEGAFTIEARESYEHRIRDVPSIERQILEAFRAGRWQRNHVVVFALVTSPYADIIISESSSSSIELELQATGQAGRVELGDASLQFGMRRTSGRVLDLRGSRNVGPACQLVGLKRRWPFPVRSEPLFRGTRAAIEASVSDLLPEVSEVQIEDYQLALLGSDDSEF